MTGSHAWGLFALFVVVGSAVGFLTALWNRPKDNPTIRGFLSWWAAIALVIALVLSAIAAVIVGKFSPYGWAGALDSWGPIVGSVALVAVVVFAVRFVRHEYRTAGVTPPRQVWHLAHEGPPQSPPTAELPAPVAGQVNRLAGTGPAGMGPGGRAAMKLIIDPGDERFAMAEDGDLWCAVYAFPLGTSAPRMADLKNGTLIGYSGPDAITYSDDSPQDPDSLPG